MIKKPFLPLLAALIIFALTMGSAVFAQSINQGVSREDFINYLKETYYEVKKEGELSTTQSPVNYGWQRVVKDGFGNLNNEYPWTMKAYTNKDGREWLYVGTMNQNARATGGTAEVWRSQDGENFEFVRYLAGFTGVRGMTEHAGLLWLGTLKQTDNPDDGCQIWVTDGTRWKVASLPGFEVGAQSTRGIAKFQDELYTDAGQLVGEESAQIFKYEGTVLEGDLDSINPASWVSVTPPEWGPSHPINSVGEMIEFKGSLYAGTWSVSYWGGSTPANGCEVWRYTPSTSPAWVQVSESGFGRADNVSILSMSVFKEKLYAGTQRFTPGQLVARRGGELWRWDGESLGGDGKPAWERVIRWGDPEGEGLRRGNMYMWSMIEYDDQLLVGTHNMFNGGELWASYTGDTASFRQISEPGMRRDTHRVPVCVTTETSEKEKIYLSELYGVRSLAKFKNKLYVGMASWAYFVDGMVFSPYAVPVPGMEEGFNLGCPDEPPGPFGFYMHSPYVGCEIWRIEHLPETLPVDAFPVKAYPNPCYLGEQRGVVIDYLPQDARVFIYTISGELVRTLEPAQSLPDRVIWDGKNEKGELVARGIYIYIVVSPSMSVSGKIAIIK